MAGARGNARLQPRRRGRYIHGVSSRGAKLHGFKLHTLNLLQHFESRPMALHPCDESVQGKAGRGRLRRLYVHRVVSMQAVGERTKCALLCDRESSDSY